MGKLKSAAGAEVVVVVNVAVVRCTQYFPSVEKVIFYDAGRRVKSRMLASCGAAHTISCLSTTEDPCLNVEANLDLSH